MAHKFLRVTYIGLTAAVVVAVSQHAAWALENSSSAGSGAAASAASTTSTTPTTSTTSTSGSAPAASYTRRIAPRVSPEADAVAALAAGTYGGPITQYCDKLAEQLKKNWKKLALVEGKDNWAFCRIDENGRIAEAVSDDKNIKDYLLNQQGIKNPPITAGKPLWLGVYFHKKEDEVQVQLKDVDYGPFLRGMQRKIKRVWFPPKGQETKRMAVQFKISATKGEVSDIKVTKQSGNSMCDAAGVDAVSHAAPFGPLPDGAPAEITIEFAFDYNVFSGAQH